MRVLCVLLIAMAVGCDGGVASRSKPASTRAMDKGTPTIFTITPYEGDWPADAETVIKGSEIPIPDRARIQCGNLSTDGTGVCLASWTKPNGGECNTEFTFVASGGRLANAYDGQLMSCTGRLP